MNLLVAWKKVLLFGLFGAAGCLAGWLVGEPFLLVNGYVSRAAGAGQGATLISKPTPPATTAPPLPEEFRRVERAGGKSGDVQISLIWNDSNDLDLHCVDPTGAEVFWRQPTTKSRGTLDVDRNRGCQDIDSEPVENIYWPTGGVPPGEYAVYLNFYQQCRNGPNSSEYKINVLYRGERKDFADSITKVGNGPGPKRLIHRFKADAKLEVFAPPALETSSGATLKVPVAVRREFVPGKVTVKVEGLPAGVTAEPLTLPAGQNEGEVVLKVADSNSLDRSKIKFVATGDGADASFESEVSRSGRFSLWTVLAIGFWTALLAVGLCLALVAGQNYYLGKKPFAAGRIPLAMVIAGAAGAGFASGTLGQALFHVFQAVGAEWLGSLMGWVLLGGLLGFGVSFFIPNLDGKKAGLAGLGGGFLGALAFLLMSLLADLIGRFFGAALLGFCIGLMVAVVEMAFRRAWLEVRFSEREVITVNLGPEPVKVGGDSRMCTVWARGAADVALRYWLRDGKVYCEDVPNRREAIVSDGDSRPAGNVTVIVRTGNTSAPPLAALPVIPARPALPLPPPVPPATPQAAAPKPAPPVEKKPAPTADYDDGMPMPMSPPPPVRSTTKSILDLDDMPAPKPAPKPPAPKPPAPTRAAAPPAPKPNIAPKGDADSCPTCGRKIAGKPGTRYCMVCDKTF